MNNFDTLLAQTCVEDCLDRLSILGSIGSIHPRQHPGKSGGDNYSALKIKKMSKIAKV